MTLRSKSRTKNRLQVSNYLLETPMSSKSRAKKWPYPRHRDFVKGLRDAAGAWFKKQGYPGHLRMKYCLAERKDWHNNIIHEDVVEYIEQQRKKCKDKKDAFPLHKYLHHGLSSQAMVFNLIGPMIVRMSYAPLIEVLRKHNVDLAGDVASAEFEHEDRDVFHEDSGQPTSLDVALMSADGNPTVFIESKFVEQEYGGCSVFEHGDCDGMSPLNDLNRCYLHFIGRRYWKLMKTYGFDEMLRGEKQCIFTAHYQFFREVLFALEKGGVFVLLSDARSPVFHCRPMQSEGARDAKRGLMPFLLQFVPEKHRNRIVSITVQELVKAIQRSKDHQDWIGEFKSKYGLV